MTGATFPALARLVGDPEVFLRSHFGRAPHLLPADGGERFADVLDLSAVDEILASSGLRAPAFRMVRDGKTLPSRGLTRRGRIGSRPIQDLADVAAIQRAFADGATLVLQGLHRSRPTVGRLCRQLELELHHPVQANAYLTPPVASGLSLHADAHDVFAVQTHGRKRWVVHPPDGEVWDLELEPGDVLYLPRGIRHAAQTIAAPSLHLTLGVRARSWGEVAQRLLADTAASLPDAEAVLPGAWADDPGRWSAQLATYLEQIADTLREPDLAARTLEDEAARFWATRPAHLEGGLADILAVDDIELTTPVARRPGSVCRLGGRVGDDVRLLLGDRVLRLPASLHDALVWLADQERFQPKELTSWLDEDSAVVLVRRLVREGLLTTGARGA